MIEYARVSTNEQEAAVQVSALKTAGRERIYREEVFGTVGIVLKSRASRSAPGFPLSRFRSLTEQLTRQHRQEKKSRMKHLIEVGFQRG